MGQLGSVRYIGRCHHGIRVRQLPTLPILLGRHVVPSGQIAPEHLLLRAVLKADQEILPDRFPDRHCRYRQGNLFRLDLGRAAQRGEDYRDHARQIGDRYGVGADLRCHDLGGQAMQTLSVLVAFQLAHSRSTPANPGTDESWPPRGSACALARRSHLLIRPSGPILGRVAACPERSLDRSGDDGERLIEIRVSLGRRGSHRPGWGTGPETGRPALAGVPA